MPWNSSLDDRHALVCGGSDGIGQAIALALAEQGATVAVLARRTERLEALLPKLKQAGAPDAYALTADLNDRHSALQTVVQHIEQTGGIHILVNNSAGPGAGPILDAQSEAFAEGFGRHVLAAHELLTLCLPGMRHAGYGRIINIISTSVREPIVNLGVSNTIRGAMASWAKSVSKELPAGVTINNILPGFTQTARLDALKQAAAKRLHKTVDEVEKGWLAMIPEGRLAQPEEIGGVAAFLASPMAAYIRGVSLPVDGGRLASI